MKYTSEAFISDMFGIILFWFLLLAILDLIRTEYLDFVMERGVNPNRS